MEKIVINVKNWEKVVGRTALPGMEKTGDKYDKWLLIWSCEIVGELGEHLSNKEDITEIGDIMYAVAALNLLVGIPLADYEQISPTDTTSEIEMMLLVLQLLEHSKKIFRDGSRFRQTDLHLIRSICKKLLNFIANSSNRLDLLNVAIEVVEIKLMQRYPNGFSPEASVNRISNQ